MAPSADLMPCLPQRDLRSSHHAWKRGKDSSAKWAWGSKQAPGVFSRDHTYTEESLVGSNEAHLAKRRPVKKASDDNRHHHQTYNWTKFRPHKGGFPTGQIRSKGFAAGEIRDPSSTDRDYLGGVGDFPPTSGIASVLYSFDRAETTPLMPVTLEVFVKTTGRETEKLVEREYEVLDGKGEVMKGRRARRVLRKGLPAETGATEEEPGEEDEGFQLL